MKKKFEKTHRIALFFSNFGGGGIPRVMLNLAAGFLKYNIQVDLILLDPHGPQKSEVPEKARLIDLKTKQASKSIPNLIDYLKTEQPSSVLSAQTHLNLAILLARFLSGWRGRLILSEHIAIQAAAENPTGWKDRFFPLLASLFYRLADKVIVVSQSAADNFLQATGLPAPLINVIHNPVVTPALILQSKIKTDHQWLQKNKGPVFLAAGRLTLQKGFDTLLKAFHELQQKVPQARLIILGEGEQRSNLEQLAYQLKIEDKVSMPGFVNNPFAYMARSDVFVLSSRWEGFANVLAEAMACGTPVVSTDCPSGPAEILENGKFGLLTPVGDSSALADAMLKTLQNPIPSDVLRERANHFSVEQIVPKYLDILLIDYS